MKNFIKKLVSVLLVFTLFSNTFLPTFWFNGNKLNSSVEQNIKTELEKNYKIKYTNNTSYWKAYILWDKNQIWENRFIWDLIDFAMAGWSWHDFFKVPSLKNLSFAVLDAAAILPFVPSTRYIRTAADVLDIAKDIKKLRWWENFLKRVTKIATKWNQSISAKAYEELYDFFKKDKKLADNI